MKKYFFVFGVISAIIFSGCDRRSEVADNSYRVGGYEVFVLVENEGVGNTAILIDPPQEALAKYAPDGSFPNALNAILIRKGEEVWIVDTGFGKTIFEKMDSLGIPAENVAHVMLTHMHGDHIGGMLREGVPAFPNAGVTLSEREYQYWSSGEEMMKLPEDRRGGFLSAQKILAAYAENLSLVRPAAIEDEFADGIHVIEAYGHTPGHVMYLVKDGKDELLIWGDLTHAIDIQTAYPEVSVTYDSDPGAARDSRLRTLAVVAEKNIPVAGMHVPYGGIGSVAKSGDGAEGYVFTPVQKP